MYDDTMMLTVPSPIQAREKRVAMFINGNGVTSFPSLFVEEKQRGHGAVSVALDSHDQAWQHLVSRTVPADELAPLLEAVFSNADITDTLDHLRGDHVQTFIDVIDTVRCCAPWPSKDRLMVL